MNISFLNKYYVFLVFCGLVGSLYGAADGWDNHKKNVLVKNDNRFRLEITNGVGLDNKSITYRVIDTLPMTCTITDWEILKDRKKFNKELNYDETRKQVPLCDYEHIRINSNEYLDVPNSMINETIEYAVSSRNALWIESIIRHCQIDDAGKYYILVDAISKGPEVFKAMLHTSCGLIVRKNVEDSDEPGTYYQSIVQYVYESRNSRLIEILNKYSQESADYRQKCIKSRLGNVSGYKETRQELQKCVTAINDSGRDDSGDALTNIRGINFELYTGLRLSQQGKKIWALRNVIDDKEFDIVLDDTYIECKNINWDYCVLNSRSQNSSSARAAALITFLNERGKIAAKYGKKFIFYSGRPIPQSWQRYFAGKNIEAVYDETIWQPYCESNDPYKVR